MKFSRPAVDLSRLSIEEKRPLIRDQIAGLTPREYQVASDMVLGRTAEESAGDLGIAKKTVEVYRFHVLKAFGARSAVEITRMLTIAGW